MVNELYRVFGKQTVTLCDVLQFFKEKFDLDEITEREIRVIAVWKYDKNDLSRQYKALIAYIYYFVMLPKEKLI